VVTDPAGNSSISNTIEVKVDNTAPVETMSTTIGTNSGSTTTITSGGLTKDNTLALSGTVSDANGVASVHVFDGATDLGAATISSGTWTFTTTALADGGHSFTAKATDNAGNLTTTSPAVTATVDTTGPIFGSESYSTSGKTLSIVTSDNVGVASVQVLDTSASPNVTYNLTLTSGTSGNGTWTVNTGTNIKNDNIKITITDLAGNQTIQTQKAPAGVAGSPIDLGLTDLSDHSAPVTVSIAALPNGWTIAGATQNADGSWTVSTSDVHGLTVTTPADFTGATVLDVVETWTNADGSTGTALVADNVEAYAPGNPIFALAGDDNLTGSSGHDQFVFSQPIGHDTVYSFDAASDQIDLIGYGMTTFADVQAHTANDAAGNAVITLGDGQSITLEGVDAASLTSADFTFDQTPVVENAGTMTIGDGAMLPLSGTIENTGTIELQSAGNEVDLQLIEHGVVLMGGGHVVMSDMAENVISGTAPDVTLDNVDNVISGAGEIGAGTMTLVNEGSIVANGVQALHIDTGANTVVNSGTLEATGAGGLIIESGVANSGVLWANGGNLTVEGDVSGSGTAKIDGAATLEFAGASSAGTTFDTGAAGTLKLDLSALFTGTVSGFAQGDKLDMVDIAMMNATSMNYTVNADGSGGTLTVSDGTHTANIGLLGQYDPAGFQATTDGAQGTAITYDPTHHTV
jgi:hypothetical protein